MHPVRVHHPRFVGDTQPGLDPVLELQARQVARLRKLSEEADLDPEFSEKFLRFIIDEVIRHHEKAQQG